jgi:hypothetical protein
VILLNPEFWNEPAPTQKDTVKRTTRPKKSAPIQFKQDQSKLGLDAENIRDGLAQLVLTVVELVREIMEKQAIRRIDAGSLSDKQIEELGLTFQKLKAEVSRLRDYFELTEDDLNIDLGPLGKLREVERPAEMSKEVTLVEMLDRILAKGVAARGDVVLSIANVDLVVINLALLIASMETAIKIKETSSDKQVKEKIKEVDERIMKLKKQKKVLEKIKVTVE